MRSTLHAPRPRKRSIAAATLGALALLGSMLVATPAQALNDTGTGGVFVSTTGRVLDTKNNIGGYNTPMPAGGWRTVKVTGSAGLPDDGTVGAVSLVATVADIPGQGQLFGRPDANTSSTLMGIYGGANKANTSFTSVLAVAADGTIQVKAETSVRLILDVQGYYTANTDGTAAGGFVPSNGKRVADSRYGTGIPKAQLTSGKTATLQVTGTAGVPAGASAVIVNLIATNATSSVGYLTPYATGAARPANSFNYAGSIITTMQAQVPLSADGKITIYNANSTIDLAIDIQGYFTAAGTTGAMFTPGQGRIVDTRSTGGNLTGNETRAIQVAGTAGVPVIGSGINAVVLTLTSMATNGGGWARVWANGTTEPDTAPLRYEDGTIRTNTITVPVGANGKISLHNLGTGATNFVIDVQGWYANPLTPKITCPAPYVSDGQALPASDSTPMTCTITVSPATASGEVLAYSVDSDDVNKQALSATNPATLDVTLTPSPGVHAISAYRMTGDEDVSISNDYSFTVGTWSESAFVGVPTGGETTNQVPYLGVSLSSNFSFPENTVFAYSVSTDEAGLDVVWSSGKIAKSVAHVDGLGNGAYFWHATVEGSDAGGEIASRTTPAFAFVTSDDAANGAGSTSAAAEGEFTVAAPLTVDGGDADSTSGTVTPNMATARGNGGEVAVPFCKSSDNSTKKIGNSYPRKHWPNVVKGGYADLVCGTPATRGMRHIWKPFPGHMDDWIRVTNKYPLGIAPEDFMVQSLQVTYKAPSSVDYRLRNDTFTYYAPVQIKNNKGQVVRTYQIQTGVGNGNWKIITGFPT